MSKQEDIDEIKALYAKAAGVEFRKASDYFNESTDYLHEARLYTELATLYARRGRRERMQEVV